MECTCLQLGCNWAATGDPGGPGGPGGLGGQGCLGGQSGPGDQVCQCIWFTCLNNQIIEKT